MPEPGVSEPYRSSVSGLRCQDALRRRARLTRRRRALLGLYSVLGVQASAEMAEGLAQAPAQVLTCAVIVAILGPMSKSGAGYAKARSTASASWSLGW